MDSIGGPRPQEFTPLPEKFRGGSISFDDGGVATARQHGGVGTRTWLLIYKKLTPIQAAILDSHFASAIWLDDEGMSAETFTFRERSDVGTTLYGSVRYTKFEVGHSKVWIQERTIELTRFP